MKDIKNPFDHINKNLDAIRHEIEQGLTEGNLSFNSQNESFFRDVFSFIYDCHFENTDFRSSVSPCIDLVCHNKKIACQITTTKTKEKLQKTLTALKTAEYQDYDIKIFCLLDKPYLSGKSIKYIKDKFHLNILDHLINSTSLIKLIENIEAAKTVESNDKIVATETENTDSFVKVFEELGVSEAALESFYKILEAKNIPPKKHAPTLRKIAQNYLNNLKKLANLQPEDEVVKVLLTKAEQVLKQGEFSQAEALINQAKTQELLAAKTVTANANKRLLSGAELTAQNGRLQLTQLKYLEAAKYFQEALNIVPVKFAVKITDYLTEMGRALYHAGQYPEAESFYQRSLEQRKDKLGENHLKVAANLLNLATLYEKQGKYTQAEPLYQKAFAVVEQILGKDDPRTIVYKKHYDSFLAKISPKA